MILSLVLTTSLLFAQTESAIPSSVTDQQIVDQNINQPASQEQLTSNQFFWDVTDEKDPFKPYRSPRALKQDAAAPVDPLTLLDLSQVQILAILWNNKIPRAVLKAADGKTYTIFRKTRLGSNSGMVVDIREGEVIVVESFDDGFGNIVKEVKPLRLMKARPTAGLNPTGEKQSGEEQ